MRCVAFVILVLIEVIGAINCFLTYHDYIGMKLSPVNVFLLVALNVFTGAMAFSKGTGKLRTVLFLAGMVATILVSFMGIGSFSCLSKSTNEALARGEAAPSGGTSAVVNIYGGLSNIAGGGNPEQCRR